jgi:hypothetical protein
MFCPSTKCLYYDFPPPTSPPPSPPPLPTLLLGIPAPAGPRSMRILITGGTGYVGNFLLDRLVREGTQGRFDTIHYTHCSQSPLDIPCKRHARTPCSPIPPLPSLRPPLSTS